MMQPTNGKGTWMQHARAMNKARAIPNSSRNMGIYVLGGRGTGKSRVLALVLAMQDFLAHRPQVIFDPLGTTSAYFFDKLVRILTSLPKSEQAKVWNRIVYVDMSGQHGFVSPFPLYYRRNRETLQEIAERYLTVVQLSNPALAANAPVSWPSMHQLGVQAGTILASLGLQVTQLRDLLFNTLEWEKTGRFTEALRRYPEDAAPAVSYFREYYLPMSRADKTRLMSTLFDHVFKFISDRNLRAVFAARTPGIIWSAAAAKEKTVFLDYSGITTPETKRFALLWTFSHLYEFIKQRTRSDPPFGVIIDEFAAFAAKVGQGTNPLAGLLDEFIQQYMRNSNIWLTIAHQSLNQLDDQLQNTVLSLGNFLFAQPPTREAAELLADALFQRNPYWVKSYRRVTQDMPRAARAVIPESAYAEDPLYFSLDEQRELFAQRLLKLPLRHFLLRPAAEGVISQTVIPITIRSVDLDPLTNGYHYPDQTLLDTLFPKLAAKDGIPITDILTEQETRLTGVPQDPRKTQPLPAEDSCTQQPERTHPIPDTVKEIPPLPTLAADQQKVLTFLMEHPDTPVSDIAKQVGMRGATLAQIRRELTAQGFLQELEVRTGSTQGGRPVKYLIPTLRAWEQEGSDPPKGRGGAIHRHVQRMVVSGALAKGYSATSEQHVASGGIVDVELQKGAGVKIAVEIAIASRPEREIAHYRNCLSAGYHQVYGIFADDQLLERTAALLGETFSAQDARHVRLLPLSMLGNLG